MANTPYIIYTTKAKLTFNIGENETVALTTSKNSSVKSADGLWEFRGMYSYKKWAAGDSELGFAYGYTAKSTKKFIQGRFARNAAGAYINAFRAYLLYTPKAKSEPLQSPNFLAKTAELNQASIDGFALPETMDIVIVEGKNMSKPVTGRVKIIDGWFDMMGRKLKAKPTVKGIYYYNGKQVRIY